MDFMVVKQVAKEFNLPLAVVYWLASTGIIPTRRVGLAFVFNPLDVRRVLEELGVIARDTTTYPEAEAV